MSIDQELGDLGKPAYRRTRDNRSTIHQLFPSLDVQANVDTSATQLGCVPPSVLRRKPAIKTVQ